MAAIERLAEVATDAVSQPWVAHALSLYGTWLHAHSPTKPALHKVYIRHLDFFTALDSAIQSRQALTGPAVLSAFGSAALRKHLLPWRFLQEAYAIGVSETERQRVAQEDILSRVVARAKDTRFESLITSYGAEIARDGVAIRTQRMYLSAAIDVCAAADRLPNEAAVRTHIERHPGARTNLARFIRYLNEARQR